MKGKIFVLFLAVALTSPVAWAGKTPAKSAKNSKPAKEKRFEARLGYYNCGSGCTEGEADWGGGMSVGVGYATFNSKNKVEQNTRINYVPGLSFSEVDTSLGIPITLKGEMTQWDIQHFFLIHPKTAEDMTGFYYGGGVGYLSQEKDATAAVAGVPVDDETASQSGFIASLLGGYRWTSGLNAELGLTVSPGFAWQLSTGYSF